MTPPNPDDVALCAKFVGVKCSGSPTCLAHSPSPDLAWRIVERLDKAGCEVRLKHGLFTIDDPTVLHPSRGPDIYAACADYLRSGK